MNKKLGHLGWIEYRDLKKGSEAFKEIHDGTCVAPKIILNSLSAKPFIIFIFIFSQKTW